MIYQYKLIRIIILVLVIGLVQSCSTSKEKSIQRIGTDISSENVSDLKITALSTMLVSTKGMGEWGYAALVEVDGKKILFDTGRNPNTVLDNAEALGIDLAEVEDVVLSHNHGDPLVIDLI